MYCDRKQPTKDFNRLSKALYCTMCASTHLHLFFSTIAFRSFSLEHHLHRLRYYCRRDEQCKNRRRWQVENISEEMRKSRRNKTCGAVMCAIRSIRRREQNTIEQNTTEQNRKEHEKIE